MKTIALWTVLAGMQLHFIPGFTGETDMKLPLRVPVDPVKGYLPGKLLVKPGLTGETDMKLPLRVPVDPVKGYLPGRLLVKPDLERESGRKMPKPPLPLPRVGVFSNFKSKFRWPQWPGQSGGHFKYLNLEKLKAAVVKLRPYEHVFVEKFISPQDLKVINDDFPPSLKTTPHVEERTLREAREIYGAFATLLAEMRSPELQELLQTKFRQDLNSTGKRLSMRGITKVGDGRIHCDKESKVLTILLYLNEAWPQKGSGGHLRLLTSRNYRDYVEQIPSYQGNLVVFKNPSRGKMIRKAGFHGYLPYLGERRVIQLNYQTNFTLEKQAEAEAKHKLQA
ncbi:hypothetical protein CYMTET_26130 [Cymbomonas tetramitiformis]|uniref:Prolyl 4-hydroxylase alpha subunit Fe(2+) 2OG dioxygenase domain-containing protein n=1 Tax=Cymbomonas tetramitiformis TaxID=36881 RepID=A0AAE0FSW0_9CHLO|nr:hypothetical protein CYMTET_26130 [Cymbomonas tetramitiformis]